MKAVNTLLLCMVLFGTFQYLEAQKYCSNGLRYNRYCYNYWWGWRICYNVPEYYCKFNRNPSTRPIGSLRMQQSEWLDDKLQARPEVWYSNQWGTICSLTQYWWDNNDAELICQQYGLAGQVDNGAVSKYSDIDPGTGRVWIDYTYCSGNYDWISTCHTGWGAVSDCTHQVDAAVSCRKQGIVRLINGPTPFEGRLQVYHAYQWRKVCDDYWDNNDASVVCRELGFGSLVNTVTGYTVGSIYGRDYSSSYWLDNLHCTGDESGLSWCRRNSWGSEDCSWSEEISVNCSIPSPATTATVKSANSIEVTMTMDEAIHYSVSLTGYKVDYKHVGDDTFRVEQVATTDLSYTYLIEGLFPYTQYNIKTTAIFEEAQHKESFSSILTYRTAEALPGPVNGCWWARASSTSIRVYWTNVPQPNGVITKFSFRYWAKDPTWNHHNGVQFQEDENARQYYITGLRPYTTYAINCRAVNSAGEGENTRLVGETLQAAPGTSPRSIYVTTKTANSFAVQWMAPSREQVNGVLTNYIVQWRENWGTIRTETLGVVGAFSTDSLKPYTIYRYRVSAKTEGGQGPFSSWRSTRTDEAAPTSSPQGVGMTALSSTQAKITWSQPGYSGRNGVITKYTLHFGDDKVVFQSMDLPPTQVSYTIMDTEAYTLYYARVAAWTSKGMGPFSSWVQTRTRVSTPTLPAVEINIADITSTTAKATWKLPAVDGHNGRISRSICKVFHYERGWQVGYYNPDVLDSDATQEALINKNLKPHTKYIVQVAVRNWYAIGPYSSGTIFQTLADVPLIGPPILQLTAYQDEPSVTIRWRHVWQHQYNDEELSGYRITYEPTDNSLPAMTMDVPYTNTYTVTGLLEATSYYFRMQAINSAGVGPYSDEMTIVTTGQAPANSPMNVRVWAVSSTQLHVQWDPPPTDANQLVIDEYRILYNAVGDSNIVTMTAPAVTPDDRHELDIPTLSPFTDYIVVVHAHNTQGGSPGSLPYLFRTLSSSPRVYPTITGLLENATEVTITWDPITPLEATGVVTGYSILYGPVGRPQDTLHLAGDQDTHDFFHLEPFTQYSFRMAVTNQNGTSVFSSPMMVTTDEAVPSSPREFRAQAISPTVITLTWNIPSYPNGELSYVLNYTSLRSDIMDSEEFELSSGLQTTYNVTDLQEDVEYEFQLVAKTSIGVSHPVIAQEMTFEAVPIDSPYNVTAIAVDSMSVQVTWTEPPVIFHNGELVGYSINYWEVDNTVTVPDEIMTMEITDDTARTATIVGLTPFKTYGIAVAAENKAGPGPYSLDVTVTTMPAAPPSPTGFKVTQRVNDSIYLTWDKPDHANGELLGYKLSWEAFYPNGIQNSGNVTLSSEDSMFEMSELPAGVEYRCFLWMYNTYGDTVSPAIIETKTVAMLPTGALNVWATTLSSTAFRVSWLPPPASTWNGQIQALVLKYIVQDDPNATYTMMTVPLSVLRPTVADLSSSINITDLTPYTPYEISIAMVNEEGPGPLSLPAVSLTYEDRPSKCSQFEVFVFFTTINCTWAPPDVLNGVLRGYNLYLNKQRLNLTLTNLNNTVELTKLEPRTNYHVEVAAWTSAGEGERSSIIVQTEDRQNTNTASGIAVVPVYVWIIVVAVVVLVLVATLLVTVLGCVAYIRNKRARELKGAMGYAEDDDEWKLHDSEHPPSQDEVTATNPYSKEELSRRAKEKEARMGTDVVSGLKGISDDDMAGFDSAINTLRSGN